MACEGRLQYTRDLRFVVHHQDVGFLVGCHFRPILRLRPLLLLHYELFTTFFGNFYALPAESRGTEYAGFDLPRNNRCIFCNLDRVHTFL